MSKPAARKPAQQRPPANGAAQPTPNGAAPRKTRIVKRRGRGRLHDSDDEVEREALSDDSLRADDSDSDSADEDDDGSPVRDLSPHPLAPPTPESPHRRPAASGAKSRQAPPHMASSSPPAAATNDWSSPANDWSAPANDWSAPANDWSVGAEAAKDDWSAPAQSSSAAGAWGTAGGADDWGTAGNDWMSGNVDVVDFNDFNGQAPPSPSGSSPKPPLSHWEEKRARDRDARQAYLQKLNSGSFAHSDTRVASSTDTVVAPNVDPSFVPVVGQFWTHDDRLMDKGLRRLNNWNNRRAQRGPGFVARGRGRGGFGTASSAASQTDDSELPPADRATWKHDGFEELSRTDERRFGGNRGGFARGGGRGGFTGRGTRGRGGFARGGFPHVPTTITYVNSPAARSVATASSAPSVPLSERRVWFHMKPERSWTKQFDAFLFQDWSLRPRPGQGPGVRVKLPGTSDPALVRLPLSVHNAETSPQPRAPREELAIVVKLKPDTPPPAPMAPVPNPSQLRPTVAPYRPPPARQSPGSSSGEGNWVWRAPPPPTQDMQRMHQMQQVMATSSPPVEGVPPPPPYPMEMQALPPPLPMQPQPQPHPVMTAFVPPYQSTPSPVFPSPYGYPAPLPYVPAPNGYAPDGRPVYYAPPPPHVHHSPHPSMSMPMYGPPPPPPQMMPAHARHGSMQYIHAPPPPPPPAEFYPTPPPPPIMDTPFFKPARSNVRVEIRAPTDAGAGSGKVHKPSNLRTSSTPDVQEQQQQQQPALVEYAPQPQQQQAYYYYAQPPQHDGYGGYGYGAPPPPPMQYDMYGQPAPDGTVYYHQ
ncbi:hypothetical protein AURDEDRAFT_157228 [Auricularia subglabra TFB-10046 SS5]|nr:hypothetical protein AURDEDRAFT_157228 [Auricularia subglabra TFB-10046 SS5]